MNGPARLAVGGLAVALAGALAAAILDLPSAAVDLRGAVAMNLSASGVEHPVTAVLLNFRGYDTLLEIAVLLLALLGMLAVAKPESGGSPPAAADPMLRTLAGVAVPLMILAAGYLLWAGAHRPGGAFQAGAVLAAAAVLLHLAGRLPAWASPKRMLRLGLAGGFLVFLAVSAILLSEGALLRYPLEHAGALILLIEAGLTLSLGLILAGLFLVLAWHPASPSESAGEESKS
ncbi:MAG: Na+/H+ antiporter MnhB subunit-related protein [bacterium]|nr:MAG: Na+/H+ antiporter MnhB subunit-related protein [bacterium]KAF0149331.1 MAG: Na+/H+ antiporter MnhB subunit-related protein [bacterium]KAF0169853.1 MAG: Na+/H+ antiporter MnhB subunit-related protein [bacterium]TXT18562.1 MAG: Na+/H+ antiporter MnhB subunit-related protein [bacterium]